MPCVDSVQGVLSSRPCVARADGKYFVSLHDQKADAKKEEVHGVVLDRAAKYMQERLNVAEFGNKR